MLHAQHVVTDSEQLELIWAFIASLTAVLTIYMFLPILIQRQYWLLYALGLTIAYRTLEARRLAMLEIQQGLPRYLSSPRQKQI